MKKNSSQFNKFVAIFIVLLFSVFEIFAQDKNIEETSQQDSRWNLSLTTDFAYYFLSSPVTGGTHFAPITGPYDGVDLRTTFNAEYKIPTPLGEHWLVNNASIKLCGAFEFTPITIKPTLSIAFEPVPFLIFSAGAGAGTGWEFLGLQGLALVNQENKEYENLTVFKNWYLELWMRAVFQFDTGAIFPGDWTHVLLQATATFFYVGVPGTNSKDLWVWQNTLNNCKGWRYEANFILGYQMPLKVDMVGVKTDIIGYLSTSNYGVFEESYNAGFAEVDISPLARIQFSKKDFMYIVARFKSRRSFKQEYSDFHKILWLDYSGREWFFDRIAASWTHLF